jgi:hypothetical protein
MLLKKQNKSSGNQQNVSQKVYVKIDGYEKKSKKRSKRRKRSKKQYSEYIPMQIPFPAPVIYQSSSTIPYPVYKDRPVSTDINPPSTKPTNILEDIGTIGTEGRVEILDRPTKKEQLAEFITPVSTFEPIPEKVKRYREETERAEIFWKNKQQQPIQPEIKPQLPIPEKPKPLSFSMFEQPKISFSETLEQPPVKSLPSLSITEVGETIGFPTLETIEPMEIKKEMPKTAIKQKQTNFINPLNQPMMSAFEMFEQPPMKSTPSISIIDEPMPKQNIIKTQDLKKTYDKNLLQKTELLKSMYEPISFYDISKPSIEPIGSIPLEKQGVVGETMGFPTEKQETKQETEKEIKEQMKYQKSLKKDIKISLEKPERPSTPPQGASANKKSWEYNTYLYNVQNNTNKTVKDLKTEFPKVSDLKKILSTKGIK